MVEEQNLGILLPFCVLKIRQKVKKAQSGEERKGLAKEMKGLIEEVVEAAKRSAEEGKMSRGDVGNVIQMTKRLYDELYLQYTEFQEEEEMWEDIQLLDYDGAFRRAEEAMQQIQKIAREKEEVARKAEEAARKLREMGISDEQLAAAGLLNITGK